MKLTKTAGGYVVEVPDDVVHALDLREGDTVTVAKSSVVAREVSKAERDGAVEAMRRLARPLPPNYKFDREDANAR